MRLNKLECLANMWVPATPEVYTIYKLTYSQTGNFIDFESAHVVGWNSLAQPLYHQTIEEYLNQFCTPTKFKKIEFGLYYTEPEFHSYSGCVCINGHYGDYTVYMAVWRDNRLLDALTKVKKAVEPFFKKDEEE